MLERKRGKSNKMYTYHGTHTMVHMFGREAEKRGRESKRTQAFAAFRKKESPVRDDAYEFLCHAMFLSL